MGVWAIIFTIITALAIESGDITMILIFGGLAVWFIYLWATKAERKKKDREWRQKQEAEQARQRFGSRSVVQQVVRDARIQGKGIHAEVYKDRIEGNGKTYRYTDYGLAKLENMRDWKQLAICLGEVYGGEYRIGSLESYNRGWSGRYAGHVSSDGSVHVYPDVDDSDRIVGYSVHTQQPAPPPPPPGQKW